MKIAFFAPLKAPDHPVPSGDRTMARALTSALRHGGHDVFHTSDLRIYDKLGEPEVQEGLFAAAEAEVQRLINSADMKDCGAWVTYHNYYKAPDLVGPAVCRALGLKYILIEATRARKRLRGPWARFAESAEAACDQAHTIFFFTEQDAEALFRDAPAGQNLRHLPPFLARTSLPAQSDLSGPLVVVGMMRPGDKLASYAIISQALALTQGDWRLNIVGDGPARPEVEVMMARFGERVQFLGAQNEADLEKIYGAAQALVWPGVNEAFGMVYLEAQAAGLPVLAQDRPGVRDVVHGPKTERDGEASALAERLSALLHNPDMRAAESAANLKAIKSNHLLDAAARSLDETLSAL